MRTIAASVLGLAASVSAQTGTLDQSSPYINAFFAVTAEVVWQAQIMPALSGQLEGIRLTLVTGDKGEQFHVRVRLEAAPAGIPAVFDQLLTKTVNDFEIIFVDMTGAAAQIVAGHPFVLEVQGEGNFYFLAGGSYVLPPGPPRYPEPLYQDGKPFDDGMWRIAFDTFVIEPPPCYPDCDGDTQLTMNDFGCFQTAFAIGSMDADCNQDAQLDLADFGCFQTRFALGCP